MSCRRPGSICRASKREGLVPHHLPTPATLVGGISFVVLVWGVVLEEWEVVASVVVLVCLQVVVLEGLAAVVGLGLAVSSSGVLLAWRGSCNHPSLVSGSL